MSRKEINPISVGNIFGRLTINQITDGCYFICTCSCGTEKKVRRDHLKTGKISSCGCLRNEKSSDRTSALHVGNKTHNSSNTRTYNIWCAMKQRCTNTRSQFYSYYGGRGIKVCDEWLSFSNFLEDMGHPPEKMTLERIDSNGDYCRNNCRWATRKEQMSNTRANRRIEYSGLNLTITEWSEKVGIHRNTLNERLRSGWSVTEAIETPVLKRKK